MNIDELLHQYGRIYNFFYNNAEPWVMVIVRALMLEHDLNMESDPEYRATIQAAVKAREDYFSSDREAAAIALAYKVMQDMQTIYTPATPTFFEEVIRRRKHA